MLPLQTICVTTILSIPLSAAIARAAHEVPAPMSIARIAMLFWSAYIPAAKNVLMAATMNAP